MPPEKQRAYAWLLYRALVDLRVIAWGMTPVNPLSPRWWRRVRSGVEAFERVTDALHNLPAFMARDFEHFDEDFFWDAFVARASPWLDGYRAEFDRVVAAGRP